MTKKEVFHILNGDALKEQLTTTVIEGSVMVMRECLMDGPLDGNFPEEFYQNRAAFLTDELGEFEMDHYFRFTVTEFDKIKQLAAKGPSIICLWFEDDLFCQVNMWFVVHLLAVEGLGKQLYWVRPGASSRYSFGHLQPEDLGKCYAKRQKLADEEVTLLGRLWKAYRIGDVEGMEALGDALAEQFPAIREAVRLHVDRLPKGTNPGRPIRVLREIVEKVGREDFGQVFRLFQKQLPEYGYGDLQVRRMMEKL